MLCPTIIMKNNKPLYALGSGGSNRIRSAIVQIIINLIVKKMNLEDAVESPRIHLEKIIICSLKEIYKYQKIHTQINF